jgi:hypothetical protein
MSTTKRSPFRWRKAKMPSGMNTMSQFLWRRDHGDDKELWCNGTHYATAYPTGRWVAASGGFDRDRGRIGDSVGAKADDQAAAMDAAKAWCDLHVKRDEP